MSQLHYRTCHLCETMCGIEVEHDAGKILAIRGDKEDVLSRGNICPKTTGLQDIHVDPDRLRRPLKRARKDPEAKSFDDEWTEVGWEEAFDYAAKQLAAIQREHGVDSIGSYGGRSVAHNIGCLLAVDPLRRILGSKHVYTGSTYDQMPHNFVWHHMLGHQFFGTVPDINRTQYYLMLGTNPKISNGAMMSTGANTYKKLDAIRARGGKTVLIDPRRNESVPYMSEHHFIRPDTDALFLLGVIQTVFVRGLATPGRLGPHITGWDEIERTVAEFDMDRIAEATGIARDDIERIAVEFACAESAVCYGRTGVSMVEFGGLCQWLMQVLNVVTGNLDEEGGMLFPLTAIDTLSLASSSWDRYRSRVSGRPEFSGELPMAVMPEEILTPGEGQLRGLVSVAGNPVLMMADGQRTEEALQNLEFMVSVDFYLNETTRYADIILPPVGPFEKSHYDLYYHLYDTINWSKYSPRLFEPEAPGYTDLEIFTEVIGRFAEKRARSPIAKLAYRGMRRFARHFVTVERMLTLGLHFGPYGKGLNPFKKDALSLTKLRENPHGVFLGEPKRCLPERLFTSDKKIHLAPKVLLDDLPRLRARYLDGGEQALRADSDLDLKMISRLTNRTLGWMHHSPRLIKGRNPCELMLHPDDATARGIEVDSLVRVTSRRSSIELPVKITADIMPGVVCMPHGWGHGRPGTRMRVANSTPGVSLNDLTDISVIDELTGNAVLNGVPVRVEACGRIESDEPVYTDENAEEFVVA
jgi:anaerobic selenocysteine-containing dehydrogenase